ncbi:hypothetical protein AR539_10800 [Arthrobacter sp. EPSL27]|nr:hypothetical protein AR539_10800 [Arthrobacter sp. EPSL27]
MPQQKYVLWFEVAVNYATHLQIREGLRQVLQYLDGGGEVQWALGNFRSEGLACLGHGYYPVAGIFARVENFNHVLGTRQPCFEQHLAFGARRLGDVLHRADFTLRPDSLENVAKAAGAYEAADFPLAVFQLYFHALPLIFMRQ